MVWPEQNLKIGSLVFEVRAEGASVITYPGKAPGEVKHPVRWLAAAEALESAETAAVDLW